MNVVKNIAPNSFFTILHRFPFHSIIQNSRPNFGLDIQLQMHNGLRVQICPFGQKCNLLGVDEVHSQTWAHPARLAVTNIDEDGVKTKLPKIAKECTGSQQCRCFYRCNRDNKGCFHGKTHDELHFFVDSVKGLKNPGYRRKVFEYADIHLTTAGGKRACVECLKAILDCSNKKLYPSTNPYVPTDNRAKDISILSWFRAQLFCLDVDPTDGTFTFPCSLKREVWQWYIEDTKFHPDCYLDVSRTYFIAVWNDYYPNVKCRKWLRFAKCSICVQLRETKHDRTRRKEDRERAALMLKKHYMAMKRERAYHKE